MHVKRIDEQVSMGYNSLCLNNWFTAGVAELADAQDLKSCDPQRSYRFDSGPRHHEFISAGWSSMVARRAHNPEVVGSNPAPATNNMAA